MKIFLTIQILIALTFVSLGQSLPIVHNSLTVDATQGSSPDGFGLQVGTNASAQTLGAAFGNGALGSNYGAAFGFNANAISNGTAIGYGTTANNGGVAVGFGATAAAGFNPNPNNVAIGYQAIIQQNFPNPLTNVADIGTAFITSDNGFYWSGKKLFDWNNGTPTLAAAGGGSTSTNALTNGFTFTQGGQNFSGDAQNFQNQSLSGQPWDGMKKPWALVWLPTIANDTVHDQKYITNFIDGLIVSGAFNLITNNCQFGIYLDGAWMGPRYGHTNQAADKLAWYRQNWGDLTWNTTNFPNGLPYITTFCHSNNIKVFTIMYGCTNILPATADEFVCNYVGGGFKPFTNGTGAWPVDGTYGKYMVATTCQQGPKDIASLAVWGVDGFCLADGINSDEGAFKEIDHVFGNLTTAVPIPQNFPYAPYPGYAGVDTNTLGSVLGFANENIPTKFEFGKTMAYMAFQSPDGGQTVYSQGGDSFPSHAAIFYDNTYPNGGGPDNYTGARALRGYIRDFGGVPKANMGALMSGLGANNYDFMYALAIQHGIYFSGAVDDTAGENGWLVYTNILMNPAMMAINQDRAMNVPYILTDYGTNAGFIAGERLENGDWGIVMYSQQASAGQTFTLNWTQLGWPTNLAVHVLDLGVNHFVDSTNYINFTPGSFSAGFNSIFRLSPVAPLQATLGPQSLYGVESSGPVNVQSNITANMSQSAISNPGNIPIEAGFRGIGIGSSTGSVIDEFTFYGSQGPFAQNGAFFMEQHEQATGRELATLGVNLGGSKAYGFHIYSGDTNAYVHYSLFLSNGITSVNPHSVAAVTVGASPFSFKNTTVSAINCYLSDAAAYSVTLNGVAIYGSLAANEYVSLMPTNQITITYLAAAPTLTTNQW